jgi:hypothetical protein
MNVLWTTCLLMVLAAQPVETSPTPTTRLYVRTIPPGARVVLDGKELGTTDGLFLVPPGTGKLSIALDGQQPEIRQVEVSEGRITRIEVTLKERAPSGDPAPSPPSNQAQAAADIAGLEKIVAARRKLVDELRARYEAGTIPSSEVTKAEADLAEAEHRLNSAKKNLAAGSGSTGVPNALPLGGGGSLGGAPFGGEGVIDLTPSRPDRPVSPAEPPTEIEKALESKITLDFEEAPLEQVAAFLGEQGKINVSLDKKALEEKGLDAATPVTFKVSGIPLRSALTMLLRDLDLVWTIRDKTLEITSGEALDGQRSPRVYAVSDLTSNSAGLKDLIMAVLEPQSWDRVGGFGSIVADRAQGKESLVVSQTEPVHRQVAAFLVDLRSVARQPANKLPVAVSHEGWWRQTPDTDAVRKALEQKLTCEFRESPLLDVVQFLCEKTHVPMFLDRRSADQAGVAADTPLTATHKDVALQDALTMALKNVGLTYTVTDDALLLTTPEFESNLVTWAIYPVGDLVTAGRSADELVPMLTTTVAPESWVEVGGPGMVRGIRGIAQALVISQSCHVHRQIAALLAQLRRP